MTMEFDTQNGQATKSRSGSHSPSFSSLILLIPFILSLSACVSNPERDYESSAACSGRGFQAGTPEFEKCVGEEAAARMLKQQREEFEQRKQEEEYWRNRRF